MPLNEGQEYARRPLGGPSLLFPIPQGPDRDADGGRECRLRESGAPPDLSYIEDFGDMDAGAFRRVALCVR
jgi:hypothetical protein